MKNKKLIVEYSVEPCYTLGRNGRVVPQLVKHIYGKGSQDETEKRGWYRESNVFIARLSFRESTEKRTDLHDFRSDFVGIGSGLCWIWIPPKQ